MSFITRTSSISVRTSMLGQEPSSFEVSPWTTTMSLDFMEQLCEHYPKKANVLIYGLLTHCEKKTMMTVFDRLDAMGTVLPLYEQTIVFGLLGLETSLILKSHGTYMDYVQRISSYVAKAFKEKQAVYPLQDQPLPYVEQAAMATTTAVEQEVQEQAPSAEPVPELSLEEKLSALVGGAENDDEIKAIAVKLLDKMVARAKVDNSKPDIAVFEFASSLLNPAIAERVAKDAFDKGDYDTPFVEMFLKSREGAAISALNLRTVAPQEAIPSRISTHLRSLAESLNIAGHQDVHSSEDLVNFIKKTEVFALMSEQVNGIVGRRVAVEEIEDILLKKDSEIGYKEAEEIRAQYNLSPKTVQTDLEQAMATRVNDNGAFGRPGGQQTRMAARAPRPLSTNQNRGQTNRRNATSGT